jgi:hypothetical protein
MPLSFTPSRGEWVFRDSTGAFNFFPILSSISITQSNPDDVAVCSFDVEDRASTITFQNEDKIWVKFGEARVFAGHVKNCGYDQLSEVGPRIWHIEAQDYTAKLEDSVITYRKKRRREKVARRIRWILSYLDYPMDRDLSDLPDAYIEKSEYHTMTVREALDQVCEVLRLHYDVDFDNDEDGEPTIRFWRNGYATGAFDLNNDDPDYATSFPYREFKLSSDSVELANAIFVEPEKKRHSTWVKDTASIAVYGRQERAITDESLHNKTQAQNAGERALDANDLPIVEGSLVCHEPGLLAGTRVNIKNALWGVDEGFIITSVEISAMDPHDENSEAWLKSAISFRNRRKRKATGRDSGNKNSRRRHRRVGDVKHYVLDDFSDRTVEPPSHSAGDTWATSGVGVGAYVGEDKDGVAQPFFYGTSEIEIGSWVGWEYRTYTDPENPCDGTYPQYVGWREQERWTEWTVPAHPANMAGATVTVSVGLQGSGSGVGYPNGFDVRVSSVEPSDSRSGGVVGFCQGGGSATVFIPGSAIPDEGQTLYVGLTPRWSANFGQYVCQYNLPKRTGAENSGRGNANFGDMQWRVWDDANNDDIGSTHHDEEMPFTGPWPWTKVGEEGNPVVEVTGGCFKVTGGGVGYALLGPREDEDVEWGPWSDFDCSPDFKFKLANNGALTDGGDRHLEITIVGQNEKAIVRVHFGDSEHAAGVSARSPANEDFAAKAIVEDTFYRLRVDTRAGYVRAKVWEASERMPTEWDVEVETTETEDDGDRLVWWARAFSDAGDMEIQICRILIAGMAFSGERVVKELIGYSDRSTNSFPTSHQFDRGSLKAHLDGFTVDPAQEYPDRARFRTGRKPARRVPVRATYTVD